MYVWLVCHTTENDDGPVAPLVVIAQIFMFMAGTHRLHKLFYITVFRIAVLAFLFCVFVCRCRALRRGRCCVHLPCFHSFLLRQRARYVYVVHVVHHAKRAHISPTASDLKLSQTDWRLLRFVSYWKWCISKAERFVVQSSTQNQPRWIGYPVPALVIFYTWFDDGITTLLLLRTARHRSDVLA